MRIEHPHGQPRVVLEQNLTAPAARRARHNGPTRQYGRGQAGGAMIHRGALLHAVPVGAEQRRHLEGATLLLAVGVWQPSGFYMNTSAK